MTPDRRNALHELARSAMLASEFGEPTVQMTTEETLDSQVEPWRAFARGARFFRVADFAVIDLNKSCQDDSKQPSTTELKDNEPECKECLDRFRVQLSGCGVAARGGTSDDVVAKKGEYGWSGCYQDVLDLRRQYDKLVELARIVEPWASGIALHRATPDCKVVYQALQDMWPLIYSKQPASQ